MQKDVTYDLAEANVIREGNEKCSCRGETLILFASFT